MPDGSTLLLYLAASVALLIVPGPAVVYVVTRSLDQGTRAGLTSVLGIQLGTTVHIAAAALGVSAVVMTSASAHATLKYAGAAYLIGLGTHRLRSREDVREPAAQAPRRLRAIFWQGFLVNALNPKTAAFFFAFLPQFVSPERGAVWLQSVVLGTMFVALGVVSDGGYAVLAGRVRRWLGARTAFSRASARLSGGTYIALGLATAMGGVRRD